MGTQPIGPRSHPILCPYPCVVCTVKGIIYLYLSFLVPFLFPVPFSFPVPCNANEPLGLVYITNSERASNFLMFAANQFTNGQNLLQAGPCVKVEFPFHRSTYKGFFLLLLQRYQCTKWTTNWSLAQFHVSDLFGSVYSYSVTVLVMIPGTFNECTVLILQCQLSKRLWGFICTMTRGSNKNKFTIRNRTHSLANSQTLKVYIHPLESSLWINSS